VYEALALDRRHRLPSMSDSLGPDRILPLLRGRFGRKYLFVERCASTQRLLAEDAPEGAIAVADEQTEGRGRLGRQWLAPAGTSLLFSIVLVPRVPTEELPQLSVVAGGAVAAAIAEVTGLDPKVKLPNDVLLENRKVAGILAEAREGRVVLGIGVNVNQIAEELPAELDTAATSLRIEAAGAVDRGELLAAILANLEREYDAWVQGVARDVGPGAADSLSPARLNDRSTRSWSE
jgi:BirA family biotin operon repressor/biotin-[acetyl-CoA-carboxylase] ligase